MPDPNILMTTIKVRRDAQHQFASWQEKMNKIVAGFPGLISLEMRPQQKEDYTEWLIIQRFLSNRELNDWVDSESRKQLLEEVKLLIIEGQGSINDQVQGSSEKAESVVEVFVTQVAPENYDLYSKWAFKIQQIEAKFPGYQGVYIQAPEKGKGGSWITILRFDTPEHLDAWLISNERQQFLKESAPIVKELQSHRVITPFSGWFGDISKAKGAVPSVWKQTMLVLLTLFPIVMLEIRSLNPLTRGLNPSLATFIGNTISVSLVSWPMMPLAIRLLGWWLGPEANLRNGKLILGVLVVIFFYLIEIAIFW